MAKALGVGGVFFKSGDPAKLSAWYEKWLGVPISGNDGASFHPGGMPRGGYTVWAPFPDDTKYFDPHKGSFMVNLVVDDLDGALAQVKEGGAKIAGEVEDYDYGRFGWFIDPEGRKIELWEPREVAQ